MNDELQDAWMSLERGPQPPGITRRRFRPDAPVDLFVGLENPQRIRLLIVEADQSAFRPRRWTECAGFSTLQEPVPGSDGRQRLVVRLSDGTAADIFTSLVGDVIGAATTGTQDLVLERIAGRLERWQRFLQRHGPGGMSPEAQAGLYGELWVLERVVAAARPLAAAVEAWSGPSATNQDFQLFATRTCIEVKTTTHNPQDRVRISNMRQLDETGLDHLVLIHLSVESRRLKGDGLNTIVARIRGSLGELVAGFNERLEDAGYLDAHAALYSTSSYLVKRRRNYLVRDTFPRLREAEIRPGVVDVAYTIALAGCSQFQVSDEDLLGIVSGS